MSTVLIRTANPEALRDTLDSLGGGLHLVDVESYAEGVVRVESTNPDFLVFACEKQGYGEVVES